MMKQQEYQPSNSISHCCVRMTEPIVRAEAQLALCVELMRELLQSTAEDSLPKSMLDTEAIAVGASSSGGATTQLPDTLQQRLDWERGREEKRIHTRVLHLQQHMNLLRAYAASLGGGGAMPMDGRYEDVPVPVLDEEIARLAAENSRLATLMITLYDEAAAACATLENELLTIQVPPI